MMERIGTGRTAEVLAYGEGRVLKLFFPAYSGGAAYEYEAAKRVDALDVGAPRVYGQVLVEDRPGIVYERIDGESMKALLEDNPMAIRRMAKRLAVIQHAVCGKPGEGLPRLKERLARGIQAQAALGQPLQAAALRQLDSLADGDRLCHGDLHPDNVLMQAERAVVIDWVDAACGHPAADICRTSLLLTHAPIPDHAGPMLRRALTDFAQSFNRQYLAEAMRLFGYSSLEMRAWLPVVAAARLAEGIPGEAESLCLLVNEHL